MEDQDLLTLFNERSENAIRETKNRYGVLVKYITSGIIGDKRDLEEIANDTWLTLWNTIPPKQPASFKAYLCRIAKNLSLKRYEYSHAAKRNTEYEIALDELTECVSTDKSVEDTVLAEELTKQINSFLGSLSPDKRNMFLQRYWFSESVKSIAKKCGISEKAASMRLKRLREELREYLKGAGYI